MSLDEIKLKRKVYWEEGDSAGVTIFLSPFGTRAIGWMNRQDPDRSGETLFSGKCDLSEIPVAITGILCCRHDK